MSKDDIITDVAKYKIGWTGGLPETPCGAGSTMAQTKVQRVWIPAMVKKYGIRTINDIGAGDLNWMRDVKWPYPVDYAAYDLVPRHKDVKPLDLIHEVPPAADLCMCLWVLNHLPVEHAKRAQDNLLASGSKYLMVTWWEQMDDYLDLPAIEELHLKRRYKGDGVYDFYLRLVEC